MLRNLLLLLGASASSAQWQPETLPVSMPTAPYELEAYEPVADATSIVEVGSARFTVLSSRMIRMEFSASKKFEDRATIGFLNRKTAPVKFTHSSSGAGVTIDTPDITLTFAGNGPFTSSNLKVVGKRSGFKEWTAGMSNDGNLLGTIKSLDQIGPTSSNCTENAHIRIHEEVRLSPLPARFSILH